MSKSIPPKMTPGKGVDGDKYEHPAFGFVRITRPSGGDPRLFMSNVDHHHKISLTIGTADMERRHYHDHHYAGVEMITVEMSSVQFADLMAGLGSHSGVPCTIRRARDAEGKYTSVPGIDMSNTVKRYAGEVKDSFKENGEALTSLAKNVQEALDAAKVSKTKQAEILAPIHKIAREIGANMPFMADMFQEAVEGLVQEAKAVVEAYAVERGVEASEAPLLLGRSDDA